MASGIGVLRNTRQKALILGCLRGCRDEHVTAEAIIDALKANGTPVAKSTVYRYLAQLEDAGAVRKYFFAEGSPACYQYIDDGDCPKHYHLICQGCGMIIHFQSVELDGAFRAMRETLRLHVDGCRTAFYGLCGQCNEGEVGKGGGNRWNAGKN